MLPAGTVDNLLKPENKETLVKILTYHVVAGDVSSGALRKMIKEGNGTAELKTVSGGKLWAVLDGRNIVLKDEKGGIAKITIADVNTHSACRLDSSVRRIYTAPAVLPWRRAVNTPCARVSPFA